MKQSVDYLSRAVVMLVLMLGLSGVLCAGPIIQWTGPGATGHYYMVTDSTSNWTDANLYAQSVGGYLISIHSSEENDFLLNSFSSNGTEAFWIGLTDQALEGVFAWTSGEPVSYTNWSPGQPDNYLGWEDYGVINWDYANGGSFFGTWNDTPDAGCTPFCAAQQPYRAIIEFDAQPVPEPGTWLLLGSGFLTVSWLVRTRRKSA